MAAMASDEEQGHVNPILDLVMQPWQAGLMVLHEADMVAETFSRLTGGRRSRGTPAHYGPAKGVRERLWQHTQRIWW